MIAHTYAIAHWPGERRPAFVEPALLRHAEAEATALAFVVAHTRRHAMRLYLECVEAVRACDGRLERCGIVDRP